MAPQPTPGWYPDPDDSSLQRYWDGSHWTSDRIEAAPPPGQVSTAPAPAGWYPDPEGAPDTVRYWDGGRWTDDRAPYSRVASAAAGSRGNDSLVVAGYIGALIFPIAGVILGAILIQRRSRHGPWVLAVALFMIAISLGVYYSAD